MDQNQLKQAVAQAAVEYCLTKIEADSIVGIGTGSTANCFIDQIAEHKHRFAGTVASSEGSAERLRSHGIEVFDLNQVDEVSIYIDGADEVADDKSLIKGGGGAHTREKIVASASDHFICIVDESKLVKQLGKFPLPIEVIPESRSLVSRKIVSMGGTPIYRQSFVTDQGNQIIDVKGLDLSDSLKMEMDLNSIAGVVDNGIFAINKPKTVFVA